MKDAYFNFENWRLLGLKVNLNDASRETTSS